MKNMFKAGLMLVALSMPMANSLVAENTSFTETIKNAAHNAYEKVSSSAKVVGNFVWENKGYIALYTFSIVALALVTGIGYKYMSNQQTLSEAQIKALKENLKEVKKDLQDSKENFDVKNVKKLNDTLEKIKEETENIRRVETTTTNTIKTVTDKALEIKNQVETTIKETSNQVGEKVRETSINLGTKVQELGQKLGDWFKSFKAQPKA